LAESKLKRAANVKDASNILPGHGGLFDRFDGLILAAPAFYLYLQCLEMLGYGFI
jgi:phosphatidate cytidylyltransferase